MKRTTNKGRNAANWFYEQSFNSSVALAEHEGKTKTACEVFGHEYVKSKCKHCGELERCPDCGTNGDHYCPADVARD